MSKSKGIMRILVSMITLLLLVSSTSYSQHHYIKLERGSKTKKYKLTCDDYILFGKELQNDTLQSGIEEWKGKVCEIENGVIKMGLTDYSFKAVKLDGQKIEKI